MNQSHCSNKDRPNESLRSNHSFNLNNSSRFSQADSSLANLSSCASISNNCSRALRVKTVTKPKHIRHSLSFTPNSLQNGVEIKDENGDEGVFKVPRNPPQNAPIHDITPFSELAQAAGVELTPELTQHLLTLLKLGVPSDDVYRFLRDCITFPKKQTVANLVRKIQSEEN